MVWIAAGTAAVFWWKWVVWIKPDLRDRGLTPKEAVRHPFSKLSIIAMVVALLGAIVLIVLAATTPMPQ